MFLRLANFARAARACRFGSQDPYAKVRVGSYIAKTKVITDGGRSAVWNFRVRRLVCLEYPVPICLPGSCDMPASGCTQCHSIHSLFFDACRLQYTPFLPLSPLFLR